MGAKVGKKETRDMDINANSRIRNKRNWVFISILLGELASVSVFAQWTRSISVNTSYDNNAFRNYAALSDVVTQLSGYLAKDIMKENWQSRLYYRGSFNLFAEYDARNYHFHHIGGAFSRVFSKRGNTLNLGLNGRLRSNGKIYNYYDFTEASAYGNIKLNIGVPSIANFGYRLRGRWYSNLAELNYAEHYFFARYTHFFQSRTTLILEGNYGRKIYRDQITGEAISPESEPGDMNGYGHHRGGMGHMGGYGNIGSSEDSGNISSNNVQPRVGQWLGQVRLAQSMSNSTGLSADFVLRRNPGGEIRYLAGQVSGYISEDELFDDRYGYESEEISATLTQLLPWKFTFKAGIESRWKDYVNRPALDLSGDALPGEKHRKDRQVLAWFGVNKSFIMLGGKSVNLGGEFYWFDNRSSDLYYNYQVSLISFGVGMSF